MAKKILLSAVLCIVAMLCIDKTQTYHEIIFPLAGMTVAGGAALYLGIRHRLSVENIVLLLFAVGFILRVFYISYTTMTPEVFLRQHDMRAFGGSEGHSAYIEFFYRNGFALPDFDPTTKSQFYHPPLHHFLAGMWMKLLTWCGMSYARAVGSIQFLTLFYSCCCMIVSERIFDMTGLKRYGKVLAVAITACHPTFLLLSGSINNDMLSVLWIVLTVYGVLRWLRNPCMKTIIPVAIFIGLGMSTKLSVALVAVPTALVFLVKFIQAFKNKTVRNYITQFCVFGVVCVPLGMWFYIRNYLLYKVPFGYVLRLPDNSPQYLGDRGILERLFDLSENPLGRAFLNNPYYNNSDYFEYNPLVSLVKSSLFGEYDYSYVPMITPFCQALLTVNIILVIISVTAWFYCLAEKGIFSDGTEKLFLLTFQVIMLVNFITFSFQYPHTCSMDYRYIAPTAMIGAGLIGIFAEHSVTKIRSEKLCMSVKISLSVLTGLFCSLSAVVYLLLT